MSDAMVRSTGDRLTTLATTLDKYRPRLEALLEGTGMSPARLRSIFVGALSRAPALLDCSTASLIQVAMQGAELGLEIGGVLGEAYIVPFRNKGVKVATYMSGYKGLIKLAEQSGKVVSMEARLVRQGERFEVSYGTTPHIEHVPRFDSGAEVTHAYAVAHRLAGPPQFDILTRAELDAIRDDAISRAYDAAKSTWTLHPGEMARKSAVRRLCKYVPLGEKARTALEVEAMQETRPGAVSPAVEAALEGELIE